MFYSSPGAVILHLKNTAVSLSKSPAKIIFSTVFAILMCISANSFIYLPFSPVPVTMQVFTVLLSGLLLGRWLAAAAQLQYIMMGIAGLPVFAGFKNAAAAFTGPTAGYIAGFAAGAFVAGLIYDKYKEKINADGYVFITIPHLRKSEIILNRKAIKLAHSSVLFFACLAGLLTVYSSGYVYLMGFLYFSGSFVSSIAGLALQAFKLGIAPFIISDMVKIAIILNIFQLKGNYEKN